MNEQNVDATLLAGSVDAVDLSMWGLILQADMVVKTVILILVLASFWSWTIIFNKVKRLRQLRGSAEEFEQLFWSGGSLEELYKKVGQPPNHPMAAIFAAAMEEWQRPAAGGSSPDDEGLRAGVQERIDQVMKTSLERELEILESYMVFLATVGSTAPFIGLFGTVWGVIDSFQAIAEFKNASLVAVAPGIAEALYATVFGLFAAIPAVVGYNKLTSDLDRYGGRLEAFSAEFSSIVSRQLERSAS